MNFLILILALLFTFIIGHTIYKRRAAKNKKLWQGIIEPVIENAVFKEKENEAEIVSPKMQMLLNKPAFRQCFIDELVQTKKSLSGLSNANLDKLYECLNLDGDSFRKLQNKQWHIKAKGLQELALMNQQKYESEFLRFSNCENELVRNEAQCGLVSCGGFAGLRFLNTTTDSISLWQQIQLLNKLKGVKIENCSDIHKWLKSHNESVVIFSLKLSCFYNCFDVYDAVIECLHYNSLQVRLNALEYLKKSPRDNTASLLIRENNYADKIYKIAILDALKFIGDEKQIGFVLNQLRNDDDDDVKAAAAKTLSKIHPSGLSFLQSRLFAHQNPWKTIILQIANDRAA